MDKTTKEEFKQVEELLTAVLYGDKLDECGNRSDNGLDILIR